MTTEVPSNPHPKRRERKKSEQSKPKWKLNWLTLVVGLVALGGLGAAMYPSTDAL